MGRTLRGPVNRPALLKSFGEFQRIFGGLWQPSTLGYAVEQFFDNGGREALIVRVVNGARPASLTLRAADETLTLRAVRPGTREFLRASVDYDNIPADNAAEFNLTLQRVRHHGTEQIEDQEIFARLSVAPGTERGMADVLGASTLVRIAGPVPSHRPDRTLDPVSGHSTGYVASNTDGDDGAPLTDYDLIGSKADGSGLFALDDAEPFNLLCLPPLDRERDVGPGALLVALRVCAERRALLVIDPPVAWLTADDALRGMKDWNLSSANALMYFPRILAHDKLRGQCEAFAPGGAVAGMLARSDENFPVWGPPQIEDVALRPGYRPSSIVGEDRRLRLAAAGVNTIQSVRSATRLGILPRTLAGSSAGAADWQVLAARRLALFILNSVERGTRWVTLAGLRPHLQVADLAAAQVRAFLRKLHDAGAFGARPREEAFFVACDERVNPPGRADACEFHLVIGFAAVRRREYHSYRIVHSVSGSRISPVSLNQLNFAQWSPAELEWAERLADQLRVV